METVITGLPNLLWAGKMPKWGTSFRRFLYFVTALSNETDSTNRLSKYDFLSLFLTSHEDEWESEFLLCALLNKFQWWQCYQELRGSCILQGGTEQEDTLSWFRQRQFMQTSLTKEWLWGLTSTRAFKLDTLFCCCGLVLCCGLVDKSPSCRSQGTGSSPTAALVSYGKTLIYICHSPPRCKWVPDMVER